MQEGDGLKGEYMVRNCGCSGWSLKLWSQSKRTEEKKGPLPLQEGLGGCACVRVFFQAGGVKK